MTTSPDTASRTTSAQCFASRSASNDVNFAWVCCTMNTGSANVFGSAESTRSSASGPPVDAAIATARSGTQTSLLAPAMRHVAEGGDHRDATARRACDGREGGGGVGLELLELRRELGRERDERARLRPRLRREAAGDRR